MIYIIFRMSRPADVIQEVWDDKENAEARASQLTRDRPYVDGFYVEAWKLNK